MPDQTNFEALQSDRYGDPEQVATEATVKLTLEALDASGEQQAHSYVERLRRLQGCIDTVFQGGQPIQAAQHAAALHALRRLDPHADDSTVDAGTVFLRLRTALDRELSRWTSAPVQPPGPSGDTAVAEPQRIDNEQQ